MWHKISLDFSEIDQTEVYDVWGLRKISLIQREFFRTLWQMIVLVLSINTLNFVYFSHFTFASQVNASQFSV